MGKSNFKDHLIKQQLVAELVENYKKQNYSVINERRTSGKPDAREFKFSFEMLDEYFRFIKSNLTKEEYKNLTISITLGQYPEDRIVGPLQDPRTKGYQTVCLIPILSNESLEKESKTMDKHEETAIPALNFGALCPPY